MIYDNEKHSLMITIDQFEMNLQNELKILGESTKRERNIVNNLLRKNDPKQVYWFKSPLTSFSCTTINGNVTDIELFLYYGRMSRKELEKKLISLRKYYYACGLAVEKEYAILEYEAFSNLSAVNFPHFHSTLMNIQRTPDINIRMWLT